MGTNAETPRTDGMTPSGDAVAPTPTNTVGPFVGLSLVAVISLGPIRLEPKPIAFAAPYANAALRWAAKGIVLAAHGSGNRSV